MSRVYIKTSSGPLAESFWSEVQLFKVLPRQTSQGNGERICMLEAGGGFPPPGPGPHFNYLCGQPFK